MRANSPEEVHELFARHFSAGDLDSLLSLYEAGATLVPKGSPAVTGLAAIRAAMIGFLAVTPRLDLQLKKTVRAGDIALLLSTWTLKGTDSNGAVVERAGQTSDVVRRQPDGSWLLVIDVPYGAEVVND